MLGSGSDCDDVDSCHCSLGMIAIAFATALATVALKVLGAAMVDVEFLFGHHIDSDSAWCAHLDTSSGGDCDAGNGDTLGSLACGLAGIGSMRSSMRAYVQHCGNLYLRGGIRSNVQGSPCLQSVRPTASNARFSHGRPSGNLIQMRAEGGFQSDPCKCWRLA
jgi:hypothetical protein